MRALLCIARASLAGALVLAATRSARAQDDSNAAPAADATADSAAEARALFEQGVALAQSGAFEAAVQRFEASLTLSPRPSTLFNLAVVLYRLQRHARLVEVADRYLALSDPARDAADRAEIERLRAEASALLASSSHTAPPKEELPAALEAGTAQPVVASVAHTAPARTPHATHATATTPSAPRTPSDAHTRALPSDDEDDGSLWSEPWLWVGVGTGVAAVATTVIVILVSSQSDAAGGGSNDIVF